MSGVLSQLSDEEIEITTKIIFSLASKYAEQFPFLDGDDLVQEGWKILTDPAWSGCYDPNRGTKFTTWFYGVLKKYYTSFAQKEYNKTQRWDDIAEFDLVDESFFNARQMCAYQDLIESLRVTLSPCSFKLLSYLIDGKRRSAADLANELGVTERDFGYLQEELRTTTRHLLA